MMVGAGDPKVPMVGFGLGKQRPAGDPVAGDVGVAVGGAEGQVRRELWKKAAPKELQDRFEEKFFAFDPLAMPMEEIKKPLAGVIPGLNMMACRARAWAWATPIRGTASSAPPAPVP
jgi:hypothetical protein